ncbi:MAG: M20/M25/M40 family metallo-hydrolase, partial [Alphaproteobacteria bacterium]|nr:M20/M25/M40 family metallo-hydrolase [Alphaproteobacteria bacterium]MDX5369582.1 M20/M25/M40 family metallo-hydrolase [Alphaproteobacteria bacterium]MDX5464236.1 M20/M25/M40 family metallo-hydrolase [Alphaproteobacteria bacterium]
ARVAYGTEAGIFQQKGGIPTVICGPGSIEQAHKPNEFCDVAQIVACDGFMLRLVAMLENGGPASFGRS